MRLRSINGSVSLDADSTRQQVVHHALFLTLEFVAVGTLGADASVVGVEDVGNLLSFIG